MPGESQALPEGRYGRTADARADRRLKIIGAALGAVGLVVIGWFGWHSIAGTEISGQLISFEVVSDEKVKAKLEIYKDAELTGVCTLRSVSDTKDEVGRRDVTIDQQTSRVDLLVDIRTKSRATNAELIGCKPAPE